MTALPRKSKKTKILMGWGKRTNGCANPVDEEHYPRTSTFVPINRLKTNVSVSVLLRCNGRLE